MTDRHDLFAGDVIEWLIEVREAFRGHRDAAVPCDGCTACCRSSQFVHIGPDEVDTLAHVPAELRFPAPGRPPGHVLMGYDEEGRCPMLIDDRCSIYQHRPAACRTYDCRVIAAAGVELDAEQHLIAERAGRWRFGARDDADRARLDAVRAAATFARRHRDDLPSGDVPANPTQLAVLAVDIHEIFIGAEPAVEAVRVAIGRRG